MIERIQNLLKERKANNDKGFSLVELAVVIVIIGILVAVAIPIFLGMQGAAEEAARETDVANGAAMVAAEIAVAGGSATVADLNAALVAADLESVVTSDATPATSATLDSYCVTNGALTKGPGC